MPINKSKDEKNWGEEEIPEKENPVLLRTFINLRLKSQGLKATCPPSLRGEESG
jgi:hypothetical protein